MVVDGKEEKGLVYPVNIFPFFFFSLADNC